MVITSKNQSTTNQIIPTDFDQAIKYFKKHAKTSKLNEDDKKLFDDLMNADELNSTEYPDLMERLSKSENRIDILGKRAKLEELLRSQRKYETLRKQEGKTIIADSLEYVIKKCQDKQVSAKDLEQYLAQYLRFWASLTAHPTNPESVHFTKAISKFNSSMEKLYAKSQNNQDTSKAIEDVEKKIHALISENIHGKKKSQKDEVEEIISALSNIYRDLPMVYHKLRQALNKYGYSQVKLPTKIIDLATWATGDGDGNPNSTDESLREAVIELKLSIAVLYIKNIENIIKHIRKVDNKSIHIKILEEIRTNIKTQENYIDQDHISNVEEILSKIINSMSQEGKYKNIKPLIENFLFRMQNFSNNFAKIDIRHDAGHIQLVGTAIKIANLKIQDSTQMIEYFEDIQRQNKNNKKELEEHGLDVKKITEKIATQHIILNILKRLEIMKNNPGMAEKFIMANCENAEHFYSALSVLKLFGLEKHMDIIGLFESVEDLENIEPTMIELFNKKEYLEYILQRNRFITMIAKSDTTRQNGLGAEASQKEAAGRILLFKTNINKYCPNLSDEQKTKLGKIQYSVFSGGGNSLNRGGGRISEIALDQSLALQYMKNKLGVTEKISMGVPLTTIQGHQNHLLFSHGMAAYFLESFPAQVSYAILRALGILDYRDIKHGGDNPEMVEKYFEACAVNRKYYAEYKEKLAYNKLYESAPWLSVKIGNVSSRPSARGGKEVGIDSTVEEIVGKNPQLLNNRAITVDRLCSHFGVNFVLMGVREELEYLVTQYGANITSQIYHNCKFFRDRMRNISQMLHMQDFPHAWHIVTGTLITEDQLFEIYQNRNKLELNEKQQTLLEMYDNSIGISKLVYQAIHGVNKFNEIYQDGYFDMKQPLKDTWPEIAESYTKREKSCEFFRFCEASITYEINKTPNRVIDKNLWHYIQQLYIINDMKNAGVGIINSLTIKREQENMQEAKKEVARGIKMDDQPVTMMCM